MQKNSLNDFDIIVLGGSISASITALALTSAGLSVAVIDAGAHPRFALGESLLKPTVYWLRLLAARFNITALDVLANVEKINNEIASTSGVKKSFGFVKHLPHEKIIEDQWWSNIPLSYEEDVSEAHLFRQDTDAFLFNEAVKHCAHVCSGAQVIDIESDEHSISLLFNQSKFRAQYLIDCTSAQSFVAKKYALREEPARFKSDSRTIFTHMINVHPFDDCHVAPQPALDWHEGTLHHLLDDAWVWVIPFDNQARSKNPLVSVGVTFNCNRWPENDLSAEQEWQNLLEMYPALKCQFIDAKNVRPWISTGKLQYSSKHAVADRYCLLGQAYGGIDALYSRGLLNTMQSIYMVVNKIISAKNNNDFSIDNFKPIERLQDVTLEINDLLTHGSYCGFNSVLLTTWWLSIWTLVEQQSIAFVQHPLIFALRKRKASLDNNWSILDKQLAGGDCIANQQMLLGFLRSAVVVMDSYKNQQLTEAEVDRELTDLAGCMSGLGFNFPTYSRALKKIGFDSHARLFLQLEHNLVKVVEDIDRQLQFNRKLRIHPAIQCVIRLIAKSAVAAARSNKPTSPSLLVELSGEALQLQLKSIINTVITDEEKRARTLQQASLVKLIRFTEEEGLSNSLDTSAMICLLNHREANSKTRLYWQRPETGDMMFYIQSTYIQSPEATTHRACYISLDNDFVW